MASLLSRVCIAGHRALRASTLWVLLLTLSSSPAAPAQAPPEPIHTKNPAFWIPFEPISGQAVLRQVELHYSTDMGRTWRRFGSVRPDLRGFDFRADRDGVYWFAVRTVDTDGRIYPPTLEGTRPGLQVHVDTQVPAVTLRALGSQNGGVGVEWDVRDENLDLNSLRLDYRVAGGAGWQPLSIEPAPAGQKIWNPGSSNVVEARISALDKAKNVGEATVTLNAGGGGNFAPGLTGETGSGRMINGQPVSMVNSKRIKLSYSIDEKGPSGISAVELWYTPDGRNWQRYGEDEDKSPPFEFEVNSEGLYGFTLVMRSGVNLGERPPQPGDAPQMWVEVDLTKPVVKLQQVEVGRGADSGKLTVSWSASDKNLRQQPITITYSDKEGQAVPIITNYENTGRYVWVMPPDVPFEFHIKVEAHDRANNIGSATTTAKVKVDLVLPKGKILGVEPAASEK